MALDAREFAALCENCPPVPPWKPEDAARLRAEHDRLLAKPRDVRSHAEGVYLDLLSALLARYHRDSAEDFRTNSTPDSEVVRTFMAAGGRSADAVAEDSGVHLSVLEEVLAGRRTLTRFEMAAVAEALGVDTCVFDAGRRCGRKGGGRFVVYECWGSDAYDLFDTETRRKAFLGDGKDAVRGETASGEVFYVTPGCFGFAERWEEQLNADVPDTLARYFESATPAA